MINHLPLANSTKLRHSYARPSSLERANVSCERQRQYEEKLCLSLNDIYQLRNVAFKGACSLFKDNISVP